MQKCKIENFCHRVLKVHVSYADLRTNKDETNLCISTSFDFKADRKKVNKKSSIKAAEAGAPLVKVIRDHILAVHPGENEGLKFPLVTTKHQKGADGINE